MNEQRLDALISGLTGNNQAPYDNDNSVNNVMIKNKTSNDHVKSEIITKRKEIRFCTIVEMETLKKMRLIAKMEGLMIKDVVEAAFIKAISSYESKHGMLTDDNIRKKDDLF